MSSNLNNFDQNQINEAYKNGGFLVILNATKGMTIGLDWFEFATDTNFLGFKMVPTDRSVHFLYANANDKDSERAGAPGSRVSLVFRLTRPGEILYLSWDAENEVLEVLQPISNSFENSCVAVLNNKEVNLPNLEQLKDLDSCLAPYPYKTGLKWKSLTSNINFEDKSSNHLLDLTTFYEDYREKYWFNLKTATAHEKYSAKDDSSNLFSTGFYNLSKLLSDFESTFVYFVLGQDFTSFENWKIILKILAHYQNGYVEDKLLMSRFIRTLIIQLVEFPADMLEVAQEDNLLYCYVCKIISFSKHMLPERSERLANFINEQFGWTIELDGNEEDIPEDERPMVVMLEPMAIMSDPPGSME